MAMTAGEEQSRLRSAVRTQRKKSCVIASASGMTSPVPLRVRPAVTCELIALRDNCELQTKPEEAGPLTSCIEEGGCTGVASVPFVTVEQSEALRMSCLCSMNGCTQLCQVAPAHHPSKNRGRQTQAPKREAESNFNVFGAKM